MVLGLLLIGLVIRLAIAWLPFEYQVKRGSLVDDAFYSLNVSRHLAQGHGPTFDGVNRTNGFQPLYVFMMVPAYWIWPDNRVAPVYAALTILALAGTATGYFVFRIAKRHWGPAAGLFALTLFCFSPYVIDNTLNGLETSIAALLWMIILDLYLDRIKPGGADLKTRLGLGALLAALVFTRIDGGILAVAIALDFVLRPREGSQPFARRLRLMAEISVAALILYSPWAIWNLAAFGSVMPISGEAVRFISQLFGDWEMAIRFPPFEPGHIPGRFYLGNFIYSLMSLCRGQIFFPATTVVFFLQRMTVYTKIHFISSWPVAVSIIVIGFVFIRSIEKRMDVIFIAVALTLMAYSFYVFGHWFFYRYFYPMELCLLLLSACAFEFFSKKVPAGIRKSSLAALIVAFLFIFGRTGSVIYGYTTDDKIFTYHQIAKSLDKIIPEGARVGSFQAGTIGYFSNRTVINLDGVVNADALIAMQEKKMMEYLQRERIEYVVDYAVILNALFLSSISPVDRKYLELLSAPKSKIRIYKVRLSK